MTSNEQLRGMWLVRVIDDLSAAVVDAARDGKDYCVCVIPRVLTRPLPLPHAIHGLVLERFPEAYVHCGLPAPEGITVTIKWSYL